MASRWPRQGDPARGGVQPPLSAWGPASLAAILVVSACVHGSVQGGGERGQPPVTAPTTLLSLMDSAGISGSPATAEAMESDGVKRETVQVFILDQEFKV